MELITLLKINAIGFTVFVFLFFIIVAGYVWSKNNDDFNDFLR